MTEPAIQWQRLDPKTVLAVGLLVAAPLIPTLVVMLFSGAPPSALAMTAGIWVASAVLITGVTGVDWYFTWYRITDEQFELRKGALSRNRRWIPRDRIRSVDLTSDPMRRVLGVTVVKIGTGESGSSDLKLDSITKQTADLLRRELLYTGTQESTTDDGSLAALKPAWLGYSALTVSFIAIVWGAIASAFGSFSELLVSTGFLPAVFEGVQSFPLWIPITFGVLAAVATGMLGALLLSLEMWWGFRLTRENDTTLRVRRGLLTTRSISLEERRLRGIEVAEPMLLRWFGGARTNAIATGLNEEKQGQPTESKALLPPAPRAQAQRVAGAVLREPRSPIDGSVLMTHPRAALRRRITWALVAVAPIVAAAIVVAAFGWVPVWVPLLVAVAGIAIGIAAAVDAYRNLGHRISGPYLIARRGTAIRRSIALQRQGIIGWRMRQSLFQRRSNLISVAATTAAGNGAYEVPDVEMEQGLVFAEETVPGLLAPFLERS